MSKVRDLTGQRFGKWTVIKHLQKQYYLCRCECGTEKRVYRGNLTSGRSASCGCQTKRDFTGKKIDKITVLKRLPMTKSYVEYECQCQCGEIFTASASYLTSNSKKSCKKCREPKVKDISGNKYGRLTAIKYAGKSKGKQTMWECLCDCGNIVIVEQQNLVGGHTKSCGCFNAEEIAKRNRTHGDTKTRIYRIWHDMMYRCYSEKHDSYYLYGGKGITVCKPWHNYNNFKKWALENGYSDDLSIDRIDGEKNYEPSNCRWATLIEQANNTNRNRIFEINGKRDTLANWCRAYNMSYSTVFGRIYDGWNIIDALTRPVQKKRRAGD